MPEPEHGAPQTEAVPDPLAGIEARVSGLEQTVQQSSRVIDTSLARAADDRSWIARSIIWIFSAGIGVVLVLYFIEGWQSGQWSNAASQAADLIKSVMLPVVTLILGYYFGQSHKG